MAARIFIAGLALFLIATVVVAEQSPLQDFCVADRSNAVQVNGFACKDPKMVGADDFFFSGLHLAGNTSNPVGSKVTPVTAAQLPGLNTLGVALTYAVGAINPPHTHPRATELLTVIEGSLEVGFVTSNPDNRFISKVLSKGDVFVFPKGLIHFQRNAGRMNAIAISAFHSQNPVQSRLATLFSGRCPILQPTFLPKHSKWITI
ncbi:hypothetical protein ACJRO7_016851 [Eucalyptus globulus]|uniref:Germin-like protein n=1 Tax=Eucalyptus globulus TaxID=34317 RepID=A0ABD3KVD4_EUCGL